jgi:hypothetical protein
MVEPVEAEIHDRIGLRALSTLSRYPLARSTTKSAVEHLPRA